MDTDLGIVSLLREPQTKGLYNFMDSGSGEGVGWAKSGKLLSTELGGSIFQVPPCPLNKETWEETPGKAIAEGPLNGDTGARNVCKCRDYQGRLSPGLQLLSEMAIHL